MPAAYAELSSVAEDSDDEYAYVSTLAEQIAHALVLDDDEEPASTQPCHSFHPDMRHRYHGTARPSTSLLIEQEFEPTSAKIICPVSDFAAAWRDYGPSEWDCFYMPSPHQQTSGHLSTLYTSQLELKWNHLFQEWNAARLSHNKLNTQKMWDLRPPEACSVAHNATLSVRKESIGTGVFLPKIAHSGHHYRRRAGFASSRSAYAPRHKC